MDYSLTQKMMRIKSSRVPATATLKGSESKIVQADSLSTSTSLNQFKADFKYEVSQIGRADANADAEKIENRIQGLARQMEPEHRDYLKFVINTENLSADDRAMAIELLSRNQSEESAKILKDFALAKAPRSQAAAERAVIFKAKAIEGLEVYQDRRVAIGYLDEISRGAEHSFIKDRARRAEVNLKSTQSSFR